MSECNSPNLPTAVTKAIRHLAFRAGSRLQRFGHSRQDLEQELVHHYLRHRHQHDSTRASAATFATHVCRNCVIGMLTAALAEKRGAGTTVGSLSEPVAIGQAGETIECGAAISENSYYMKLGRRSRPDVETVELQIDVARVVASLPPHLANLARRLALESVVEAAKSTGVSRATAHRNLDAVRTAFVQAGLDLYMVRRNPVQGEQKESIGTMRSRRSVASHRGENR